MRLRWWRADDETSGESPGAVSARAGDQASAPAGAGPGSDDVVRPEAPAPGDWMTAAPLAPTVSTTAPTTFRVQRVQDIFVTRRPFRFADAPLGHRVSASAPSGSVSDLATTIGAPSPAAGHGELPLREPAHHAEEPPVQTAPLVARTLGPAGAAPAPRPPASLPTPEPVRVLHSAPVQRVESGAGAATATAAPDLPRLRPVQEPPSATAAGEPLPLATPGVAGRPDSADEPSAPARSGAPDVSDDDVQAPRPAAPEPSVAATAEPLPTVTAPLDLAPPIQPRIVQRRAQAAGQPAVEPMVFREPASPAEAAAGPGPIQRISSTEAPTTPAASTETEAAGAMPVGASGDPEPVPAPAGDGPVDAGDRTEPDAPTAASAGPVAAASTVDTSATGDPAGGAVAASGGLPLAVSRHADTSATLDDAEAGGDATAAPLTGVQRLADGPAPEAAHSPAAAGAPGRSGADADTGGPSPAPASPLPLVAPGSTPAPASATAVTPQPSATAPEPSDATPEPAPADHGPTGDAAPDPDAPLAGSEPLSAVQRLADDRGDEPDVVTDEMPLPSRTGRLEGDDGDTGASQNPPTVGATPPGTEADAAPPAAAGAPSGPEDHEGPGDDPDDDPGLAPLLGHTAAIQRSPLGEASEAAPATTAAPLLLSPGGTPQPAGGPALDAPAAPNPTATPGGATGSPASRVGSAPALQRIATGGSAPAPPTILRRLPIAPPTPGAPPISSGPDGLPPASAGSPTPLATLAAARIPPGAAAGEAPVGEPAVQASLLGSAPASAGPAGRTPGDGAANAGSALPLHTAPAPAPSGDARVGDLAYAAAIAAGGRMTADGSIVFDGAGSSGFTEVPLQRSTDDSAPAVVQRVETGPAPSSTTGGDSVGTGGGGTAEDKDHKHADEEALYRRLVARMRADAVRERQRFHIPGARG